MDENLKERVDGIEERLRGIEKMNTKFEVLIESSNKTMDRHAETMDRLDGTLKSMEHTMCNLSFNSEKTAEGLKNTNDNVERLTSRISSLEEKGRFDITGWIKNNFVTIIVAMVLIGLALPQVGKLLGIN